MKYSDDMIPECKQFYYEFQVHLDETVLHESCDEFNCNSVRLQARSIMKFHVPGKCQQYIINDPEESCFKSEQCQENPNTPRKINPYQLMFAFLRLPDKGFEFCERFNTLWNMGNVNPSCNLEGCKHASNAAINHWTRMMPTECHQFVRLPEMVCIQYDCVYKPQLPV